MIISLLFPLVSVAAVIKKDLIGVWETGGLGTTYLALSSDGALIEKKVMGPMTTYEVGTWELSEGQLLFSFTLKDKELKGARTVTEEESSNSYQIQ